MATGHVGGMPPVATVVVPMASAVVGGATPPMPMASVAVCSGPPMASAVIQEGLRLPPTSTVFQEGPRLPPTSYRPPSVVHQPHEEGSRPPSGRPQAKPHQLHHGVIHEPVIPVKVRLERIAVPRPDYKEFPHHDPAYGPWFRSNQPDRDEIDRDFMKVEPDVQQPLGWLWQRHKADELAERRQKQWEAKFQEMRHPKVKNLFQPDHGPATVCYKNKFEGHSLMSWLAS